MVSWFIDRLVGRPTWSQIDGYLIGQLSNRLLGCLVD